METLEVVTASGSALTYSTPRRLIPDFIARGDASVEWPVVAPAS